MFTALPSEGNKAMHRAPATSQKAMIAYRNRIANRASPAMKLPIERPPGTVRVYALPGTYPPEHD